MDGKEYPHEKPLPENVIPLNIVTFNDVDPETILRAAYDAEIVDICVVGMTKTGDEFFASSTSDAAETIYHLTRAIHKLNRMIDSISSEESNLG